MGKLCLLVVNRTYMGAEASEDSVPLLASSDSTTLLLLPPVLLDDSDSAAVKTATQRTTKISTTGSTTSDFRRSILCQCELDWNVVIVKLREGIRRGIMKILFFWNNIPTRTPNFIGQKCVRSAWESSYQGHHFGAIKIKRGKKLERIWHHHKIRPCSPNSVE